jgi:hypothetical protein
MAYKSNSEFKTEVTNIKSLTVADGKIDATELQAVLNAIADSSAWEDRAVNATPPDFDCNDGRLQIMTLTANATLAIQNAVSGRTYVLLKKGGYTLTLPGSELSGSGNITGTGNVAITFLYDGADYWFNFQSYLAT